MMNTSQALVADPVLTLHARKYTQTEMVGHILFPKVELETRGAKVLKFGKADFMLLNTAVPPGGPVGSHMTGYETDTVNLDSHALFAKTPKQLDEEAAKVPKIALRTENLNAVLNVIALSRERSQATLARSASSYATGHNSALSGADKWSDDASNPAEVVEDAKNVVRSKIGKKPNILQIPPVILSRLKQHPKIIDFFKRDIADNNRHVTKEMLEKYFEVDRLVSGEAVFTESENAESFEDVWGGSEVQLVYVPQTQTPSRRAMGWGYTYQLKGYPSVGKPEYYSTIRSWQQQVEDEFSAEVTAPEAGFLFQNVM